MPGCVFNFSAFACLFLSHAKSGSSSCPIRARRSSALVRAHKSIVPGLPRNMHNSTWSAQLINNL